MKSPGLLNRALPQARGVRKAMPSPMMDTSELSTGAMAKVIEASGIEKVYKLGLTQTGNSRLLPDERLLRDEQLLARRAICRSSDSYQYEIQERTMWRQTGNVAHIAIIIDRRRSMLIITLAASIGGRGTHRKSERDRLLAWIASLHTSQHPFYIPFMCCLCRRGFGVNLWNAG